MRALRIARIGIALLVAASCLAPAARATTVHAQTGNVLSNGSLDGGSFTAVTGHNTSSAASSWAQWDNAPSGAPTSQLLSEATLLATYGIVPVDGDAVVKVTTSNGGDGLYTVAGWHAGWTSTSSAYTFSGWAYVLSGSLRASVGSNATGFTDTLISTTNAWVFFSVTRSGSPNVNDELLLYSSGGASTFLVDDIWLNAGTTSAHPNPIDAHQPVPEPASLGVAALAAAALSRARRRPRRG